MATPAAAGRGDSRLRPPAGAARSRGARSRNGSGDPHGLREQAGARRAGARCPVAGEGRPGGVARVGPHGEEAEERREQVLPLGDPGHRLHVEGVEGEERGDRRGRATAAPVDAREHEEEDGRVRARGGRRSRGGAAPGSSPKSCDVQHVGEPGERVPVGDRERREGPANPVDREPGGHDRVGGQVAVVVEVEEPVPAHPRVEREGRDGEQRRPRARRAFGIPESSSKSRAKLARPRPRVPRRSAAPRGGPAPGRPPGRRLRTSSSQASRAPARFAVPAACRGERGERLDAEGERGKRPGEARARGGGWRRPRLPARPRRRGRPGRRPADRRRRRAPASPRRRRRCPGTRGRPRRAPVRSRRRSWR